MITNSPFSSRDADANDPRIAKRELRAALRRRRVELVRNRVIDNRIISSTVSNTIEFQRAKTVLCYASATHLGEFNTLPLLTSLFTSNKRVCLPVIESDHMTAHEYGQRDELRSNSWVIAEPALRRQIRPEEIDLVIVPALGVSLTGDRIGYGKAYYDTFLDSSPAIRIVPIYEDFIVEPFPVEAHDQKMDIIVTERRVVRVV